MRATERGTRHRTHGEGGRLAWLLPAARPGHWELWLSLFCPIKGDALSPSACDLDSTDQQQGAGSAGHLVRPRCIALGGHVTRGDRQRPRKSSALTELRPTALDPLHPQEGSSRDPVVPRVLPPQTVNTWIRRHMASGHAGATPRSSTKPRNTQDTLRPGRALSTDRCLPGGHKEGQELRWTHSSAHVSGSLEGRLWTPAIVTRHTASPDSPDAAPWFVSTQTEPASHEAGQSTEGGPQTDPGPGLLGTLGKALRTGDSWS